MPSARIRRPFFIGVVAVLVAGLGALDLQPRPAWADQPPADSHLDKASASTSHHLVPVRGTSRRTAASRGSAESSSGWWLGTAGIALALAICGGISIASRRFLPQISSGPLRVVGRTSLSSKHTIYLLKAGDRTLIVGAGPQGPPSLLGELDDFEEVERFAPSSRGASPRAVPIPSGPRVAGGFDRRVGDDE